MRFLKAAAALIAAACLAHAAESCATCHDDKATQLHAGSHNAVDCTGCHTNIKSYPHPAQIRKVDCAGCHSEEVSKLAASVHAKSSEQPCLSCHGDAHMVVSAKDAKSSVYPSNLPKTCGTCHGDKKFAKQHGLPEVYSQYMDSIHGFALSKDGLLVSATCSSCHGSHDILDPKNPKSRTNHANVPATCGSCHAGIEREYRAGIHGEALEAGVDNAPVCTNCHTAHQVSNVREASFQMKTSGTCGDCHREKYGTYRDTFHAQVSSLGFIETAHCWDCHGEHRILSKSDPNSPVAQTNLIKTCGKCHQGANASFVTYQPHADSHDGREFPLLHASSIFMKLLLASVLGFFALHTLLWFIRLKAEKPAKRSTL